MIKHIISELYINEAVRLRSEYFEVMKVIYSKRDKLLELSKQLEDISISLKDIDVENDPQLEFKIKEKQTEIEDKLQKIQLNLKPEYDRLLKIEDDTKILYDSITEKYKGITTKEIKNQIIPYLKDVE